MKELFLFDTDSDIILGIPIIASLSYIMVILKYIINVSTSLLFISMMKTESIDDIKQKSIWSNMANQETTGPCLLRETNKQKLQADKITFYEL